MLREWDGNQNNGLSHTCRGALTTELLEDSWRATLWHVSSARVSLNLSSFLLYDPGIADPSSNQAARHSVPRKYASARHKSSSSSVVRASDWSVRKVVNSIPASRNQLFPLSPKSFLLLRSCYWRFFVLMFFLWKNRGDFNVQKRNPGSQHRDSHRCG